MEAIPRCRCRCHGRPTDIETPEHTADAVSRRSLAAAAIGGMLLPTSRATWAADVLLDPSRLVQPPKTPALAGGASSTGLSARVAGTPKTPAQDVARSMAATVVASLRGLTQAAGRLGDEVTTLQRLLREAQAKLDALKADREAKLQEYREGLFCSGCGQTRSEILAKHEEFPHSGQTIVKATEDQIRAKDRQMQAPILALERQSTANREKLAKVTAQRAEAMEQIDAGLSLWSTATTFEDSIVRQESRASEDHFQRSLAQPRADKLLLNAQQAANRRHIQARLERADAAARNECDELNGLFAEPAFRQLTTLLATVVMVSPKADFNDLGGMYRMGDFTVASHGDTLPRVESFIADFRSVPRDERRDAIAGPGGTAPRPEGRDALVRKNIQDLLK